MKNLHNFGVTISFCLALFIPAATASAQDHDRDDVRHHRYYDREHHDYHRWNRGEDRYWRMYWSREHGPFMEWDRANDEQRQAYWHWRHERMEHHDRDDRH